MTAPSTAPLISAATSETPARRLQSIDALRGAIMIIMALDHVRDFVHRGAMIFSPTDLSRTTPALFLTRWVTHFCAPLFMFLAGISAFLWWQHNHSKKQLSVFLLTRGLWLVLLEVTVMRLAYNFNFTGHEPILLIVLWALGACMMGMAALVWLPVRLLAVLSVSTILLHNCLDSVQPSRFGGWAGMWNILHQPGVVGRIGSIPVFVAYPLVPWMAVMACGFCFGRVFLMEAPARRRILITVGTAASLAFLAVRALNAYGDPAPWSTQKSGIYTALSFLNVTKYPPSLDFLLMTLGPAMLALAWLDRFRLKAAHPLIVFGRVPLFYFIIHFYLAHAAAVLLAWIHYGSASFGFVFHPVPSMGGRTEQYPPGFGYDLWVAYVVWAVIVVGLYPVCRWFARIKPTRRDWWLSYF